MVIMTSPAAPAPTPEPFPGNRGPGRRFEFDARLITFDLWFHLISNKLW